MTIEQTALVSTVDVFEIDVEIRGNHQLKSLLTKIQKKAFLKEERYLWGVDQWNRPRREKAVFTVLVKKNQENNFKTMIAQVNNHSPLIISLKKLTNFF